MSEAGSHEKKKHGARVFVPPPFLFAIGYAAGIWLRRVVPGDALPPSLAGLARAGGSVLAVAGIAFAILGLDAFARARTTVVPHRPVAVLVVTGPYGLSRNPMYVGLTAIYLGFALVVNHLWPVAILPLVLAALVLFVIRPEERYLESRFRDHYRSYCRRVRRFL